MFDVREIKKLHDILSDGEIGEIEIRAGDFKLKLSMGDAAPISTPVAPVVNAPVAVSSVATEKKNYRELVSHWVGFFTRLNPKNSEYYIKLRDEVKADDVIGHVRVLGVLQDIKAGVNGKVKEILVEEGQPIEYGQPIMRFDA